MNKINTQGNDLSNWLWLDISVKWQSVFLFTNVDVTCIYYSLRNFAWTHQNEISDYGQSIKLTYIGQVATKIDFLSMNKDWYEIELFS